MRLFRAVRSTELGDIRAIGRFRNPNGLEVKYFSATASEAERYAHMAAVAFEDGPYFLIEAEIPDHLIAQSMIVVVDGGIQAYVLAEALLRSISDTVVTGEI